MTFVSYYVFLTTSRIILSGKTHESPKQRMHNVLVRHSGPARPISDHRECNIYSAMLTVQLYNYFFL